MGLVDVMGVVWKKRLQEKNLRQAMDNSRHARVQSDLFMCCSLGVMYHSMLLYIYI